MRWVWVAVVVISSTFGDLASAKGMTYHGEINDLGFRGLGRVLRYIITHPLVMSGILSNAISFIGFLALLSVSSLSFAVPATAASTILKTLLARSYLHENVAWQRWAGVALVAIGIVLISV